MTDTVALNVKFTGDSSGVVTESRRAEGAVDKFGNKTDKASKSQKNLHAQNKRTTSGLKDLRKGLVSATKATALLGAAAAAAAVVGFGALVKEGLATADSLAKTSTKLGIASEKLAGLRLAAQQTGVKVTQFDTALQRLVRRTAEAAAGTGEAQGAFKALGLSASDLVKQKPDEVLKRIAERFNQVQNASQQVQLAFKLFDTEGVALINTLRLGRAGLEAFEKKAQTLGLSISRGVLAGVERANDAVALLGKGFDGLKQQLAARSAPFIEAIADKMFALIERFGGVEAIAGRVFTNLIKAAGFFADAINGIKLVWLGLKVAFQSVGLGILTIFGHIDKAITTVGNLVVLLVRELQGPILKALAVIITKVQQLFAKLASISILPDSVQAQLAATSKQLGKISDDLLDTANSAKVAAFETSTFLEGAIKQAALAAETYTDEFLEALKQPPPSEGFEAWALEIQRRAKETSDAITAEFENIGTQGTITTEQVAKAFETSAKRSKTAWESFGETLEKVFVESFQKGGDAFDNFIDRIKVVFQESALRSIFQGATSSIFGGAGSIGGIASAFGGTGGGGGAGGAGSSNALSLLGLARGGLAGVGGLVGTGIDFTATAAQALFGNGTSAVPFLANLAGGLETAGTNVFSGLSGNAALGAGSLITAGAGVVGGYTGNLAGEALFGKEAESSTGAAAGATAGAIYGSVVPGIGTAIGALIGGFVGALADVGFGGDGKKRSNTGILVGAQAGVNAQAQQFTETGASGLKIQAFERRGSYEGAIALQDAALKIDEVLTNVARASGLTVDFANATFRSPQTFDAGRNSGSLGFFGGAGFNGGAGGYDDAADEFVLAWLREVNDQLPVRVKQLLSGVDQTAEALVGTFASSFALIELLDIDVIRQTEEAIEALTEVQKTLFEQFNDFVDATQESIDGLDGSAQGISNLTDALNLQRTAAAQLTVAYRAVGLEISALLQDSIDRISESVLSTEEVYANRRAEIAQLTEQLRTTISPEQIERLVLDINRLANDAFNLLDETQAPTLAPEFVEFLRNVQDIAQGQIDEGLNTIELAEAGANEQIEVALFGADTFEESVNQFSLSVEQLQSLPDNISTIIENFLINSGGGVNRGAFDFGGRVEVNA